MEDGWKTPKWDETLVSVPRRLLQECELAMSEVRGLVQRLESHENNGCCALDARDRRAIKWGREALVSVRRALRE